MQRLTLTKINNYFNSRKPLLIAIVFIVILDIMDWTSTVIALRLPPKPGFAFVESNPIALGFMGMGTIYWILSGIGMMLFILGTIVVYWRYLEERHPNHLQYYLFTVSIGISVLTATVVNNIRLLIMYSMS